MAPGEQNTKFRTTYTNGAVFCTVQRRDSVTTAKYLNKIVKGVEDVKVIIKVISRK